MHAKTEAKMAYVHLCGKVVRVSLRCVSIRTTSHAHAVASSTRTALHSGVQLLLGCIQTIDIGSVMLAVVEFHYLSGDDRLQRSVAIREAGKAVCASYSGHCGGHTPARNEHRTSG